MKWLRNIICGKPAPNLLRELETAAGKLSAAQFTTVSYAEVIGAFREVFGTHMQIETGQRDFNYVVLPAEVMDNFHKIYRRHKPRNRGEVFDCDNNSIDYMAALSRFAAAIPGMKNAFAVGMVTGVFPWVQVNHQANIALTSAGVLFIEPQTQNTYEATETRFKLTYL